MTKEQRAKLLDLCDGDKEYLRHRFDNVQDYWGEGAGSTRKNASKATIDWVSTIKDQIEKKKSWGVKPSNKSRLDEAAAASYDEIKEMMRIQ
jgi:hypothetical protein